MKFIDKTLNQVEGNQLVDTFLNNQWSVVNSRYFDINYSTHPNHPFKLHLRPQLRTVMLREQNNYCCYCMRIISVNSITFEHIVPQSEITLAGLNHYTHYPIIAQNVCLQSDFENASVKKNTPPYPLQIAYENLTASCNGVLPDGSTKRTCNNFRGSNFVEPLFYVSTIEDDITYFKGGIMLSSNSLHDTSIITLHLNYPLLQRIRQVWYHISTENISDIENADTESKRNVILTLNLMGLPPNDRNSLIAVFKTNLFWNALLQYKWFYSYYNQP